MASASLRAQIACIRREIIRRADVYPDLVATRRLTARQAGDEQDAMIAVLQTLMELQSERHHGGCTTTC